MNKAIIVIVKDSRKREKGNLIVIGDGIKKGKSVFYTAKQRNEESGLNKVNCPIFDKTECNSTTKPTKRHESLSSTVTDQVSGRNLVVPMYL